MTGTIYEEVAKGVEPEKKSQFLILLRPQGRTALLGLKSYTRGVYKSTPIFHFHSQKKQKRC